jgi:hypothetical protein
MDALEEQKWLIWRVGVGTVYEISASCSEVFVKKQLTGGQKWNPVTTFCRIQ